MNKPPGRSVRLADLSPSRSHNFQFANGGICNLQSPALIPCPNALLHPGRQGRPPYQPRAPALGNPKTTIPKRQRRASTLLPTPLLAGRNMHSGVPSPQESKLDNQSLQTIENVAAASSHPHETPVITHLRLCLE